MIIIIIKIVRTKNRRKERVKIKIKMVYSKVHAGRNGIIFHVTGTYRTTKAARCEAFRNFIPIKNLQ